MQKSNKFITLLFLSLIFLMFISGLWGGQRFEYRDTFALKDNNSPLSDLANFDGVHYLQIAEKGYKSAGGIQAFFPLYPLLVKILNYIIRDYLISGLLVSWTFFIASLSVFYKLLKFDYKEKTIKEILIYLSLFSTSFYFLSFYTESLFLFLSLSFFFYLRKNNYKKAAVFGILATATRLTGIFLIPAFIYEIWQKNHKIKYKLSKIIKKYWIAVVPALGLISYMIYLKINFNDPLLFIHVQSGFGAGRETGKLILPYQVIWRYIKMFFTVDRTNPIFFTISQEFLYTIILTSLLIFAYFKKIRPSYLIYSAFSLLLPTLTGTLSSMPRYVLVLFPAYISLALIKNKYLKYSIFTLNLILLFINTALFIQGHWVS